MEILGIIYRLPGRLRIHVGQIQINVDFMTIIEIHFHHLWVAFDSLVWD